MIHLIRTTVSPKQDPSRNPKCMPSNSQAKKNHGTRDERCVFTANLGRIRNFIIPQQILPFRIHIFKEIYNKIRNTQ